MSTQTAPGRVAQDQASMIGFEAVTKRYRGDRLALDGVTLALPVGGSLGLVGESGSGKTTCVRLALGLERPTSGRLTFRGAAYPAGRRGLRDLRAKIGFVLQDPYDSLDPRMTIRDIVAEPLRIHGLPGGRGARADALVAEQLAAVGLPGRRLAQLSLALLGRRPAADRDCPGPDRLARGADLRRTDIQPRCVGPVADRQPAARCRPRARSVHAVRHP